MYYTVIKHDRHLRTRGKCRKHEPQAAFSNLSGIVWTLLNTLSKHVLLTGSLHYKRKIRQTVCVVVIKVVELQTLDYQNGTGRAERNLNSWWGGGDGDLQKSGRGANL